MIVAAGVRKLSDFGTTPDGQIVQRWELDNGNGLSCEVLNLGGIVLRMKTPDRTGRISDILLSPRDVDTVFSKGWPYLNCIVGRFAGRMGFAQFALDGKTYSLAANDPPHALHGGKIGYDKRLWNVRPHEVSDGVAVEMTLTDPDGTEGYPGTLQVKVIYTLTFANAWRIEYRATTDHATPINLTNHAYFNFKDAGRTPITEHWMQLDCTHYTPSDETLSPIGTITQVKNTPFDFTAAKPIGKDMDKLTAGMGGYDDNYCTGAETTIKRIGEVYEPISGRVMQVFTTQPHVQFYTGNFLDGTVIGLDGFPFEKRTGFCLETQHAPDAPNQPAFPDTILRPGQVYDHKTEYRFSVR